MRRQAPASPTSIRSSCRCRWRPVGVLDAPSALVVADRPTGRWPHQRLLTCGEVVPALATVGQVLDPGFADDQVGVGSLGDGLLHVLMASVGHCGGEQHRAGQHGRRKGAPGSDDVRSGGHGDRPSRRSLRRVRSEATTTRVTMTTKTSATMAGTRRYISENPIRRLGWHTSNREAVCLR